MIQKHLTRSLLLVLLFIVPASGDSLAEELPRRVSLGAILAPLSDEVRTEIALPPGEGIAVQRVFPGSGAASAGIQEGDVIVSVDGSPVSTPAQVVERLQGRAPGERLLFTIISRGSGDSARSERTVILGEFPREGSDQFEIEYGSAFADGNRYRTIVTRPRGKGPFPALFLVQGVGCFSLDFPGSMFPYERIAHELTRRGFVTLRMDKPGTGDSEGGPCPAVDFQTEVRGYQAALAELARQPFVDLERIFLFGHSMGGIMAPLIGEAAQLRGAVVYGTAFNSWLYYSLENTRRQMRLSGVPYDEIAQELKENELLVSLLYVQKQPLEKIVEMHPQFAEVFPDRRTFAAGKHYPYFQQIYDLNLAREWKEAKMPVLAVWGSADFIASESDHRWLADAVDSWIPGGGLYRELPAADHYLNRAADYAESRAQGPGGGEFDPRIIDILDEFMKSPPPAPTESLQ